MSLPVISLTQMREWEQSTWQTGQTEASVIKRAGQAVALRGLQLTRPHDRILVLAGKGHNGDDARAAADHLPDRKVIQMNVDDPELAQSQLISELAAQPALIIDGLFGTGVNRPLASNWIRFIQTINQSGRCALAVDVPSGLNADTGEPMGDAIQAALTLTLGAIKEGLLRPSAWPFVGRLEVAPDIGLVPCPFQTERNWICAADFRDFPPRRPVASHKGTFGHLAIFAGSLGYHGAAILAARGAQRAQPGLITLFVPRNVYEPIASQLQSVMVQPNDLDFEVPPEGTAILVGPGLASPEMPARFRKFIGKLWIDSPRPVIADASALDWLPEGTVEKNVLRILTPHPGEAARLLQSSAAEVQADRGAALRELSKRFGHCWVVLKGNQSLIGRSTGKIFINSSGNPHLAQGGSGDLLGGYLAGLLAQPTLQTLIEKTLCYAVWQHGAAADRLSEIHASWTVEQLATELGRAE